MRRCPPLLAAVLLQASPGVCGQHSKAKTTDLPGWVAVGFMHLYVLGRKIRSHIC